MSRAGDGLKTGILFFLRGAEALLDRLRRPRPPSADDVILEPYRSYGTRETLHVKGRLLRDRKILRGEKGERRWRAFVATWKRVFSREIAGARIVAEWGAHQTEGVTDGEGYFHLTIEADGATSAMWQEVLVRAEMPDGTTARATALVLVPPPDAEFCVVSDIDDTVVRTDATSLYRMLKTVVLSNAHVRLPFEGVAAFYRALHRERNPLFYVSSGPWNLYDLLEHVFEIRGIPPGPIFLQDWGIERGKLIVAPHEAHKREQIDTLIGTYAMPFLLIGDSGQHDPEIYASVARHYPGRVAAIWIRDVARPARTEQVEAIASELERDTGVRMLLIRDTIEASRDAAAHGWIPEAAIADVAGEKAEDESAAESL